MRLQLRVKAGVRENAEHQSQMLMFTFHLGPLEIFCLAHLPRPGEKESVAYVKATLKPRTLVDAGAQVIEEWKMKDDEAVLSGGNGSQLSLGPLHVFVRDDRMLASVRKRTVIDPKYKNVEDWTIAK